MRHFFTCLVFISYAAISLPSFANGYDDQVAIDKAAHQLYDYDQQQRRNAEIRQYGTHRVSPYDSTVSVFLIVIVAGSLLLGLSKRNREVKEVKTVVRQLQDQLLVQGVLPENIYFDSTGRQVLGVDTSKKRCILIKFSKDDASSEILNADEILGSSLTSSATIEINTKNLNKPLVVFQMLHPAAKYPQQTSAQIMQRAKQLNATILALSKS